MRLAILPDALQRSGPFFYWCVPIATIGTLIIKRQNVHVITNVIIYSNYMNTMHAYLTTWTGQRFQNKHLPWTKDVVSLLTYVLFKLSWSYDCPSARPYTPSCSWHVFAVDDRGWRSLVRLDNVSWWFTARVCNLGCCYRRLVFRGLQ